MLCDSNGYISDMPYHCKENETPMLEVSNRVDFIYGFTWGASFNISLKRLTIGG